MLWLAPFTATLLPSLYAEGVVQSKEHPAHEVIWPEPLSQPMTHWKSEVGSDEIWLSQSPDGFLRLHGRDSASSFEATLCLHKDGSIDCHGSGFNFDVGLPFVYHSTFKLDDSEEMLLEAWEATFPNGEVLTSNTRFKMIRQKDSGNPR